LRFVGFIGPSYKLNSVNVDCQRCINLYPELDELGTGKEKEIASLVGTPGLTLLQTIGLGPIRGMHRSSDGQFFVASGNKLYQVSSLWATTELGTLNSSTGHVSMADNGVTLMVVDEPSAYTVILSTLVFAQVTDPDYLGASQVTYQDGYFIFLEPDSGSFFISGLADVTFDALDIGTAEGLPDNLISIISDHRDLWLLGEKSIEVFFNSGNSDFPFERIQGAFIEHGCAAKNSVQKMNNSVYWLGSDDKGSGMVFQAKGFQPQRISTHAVEQAIQSYSDISDAVAWTYQENGHHFYVLNFPSADTTWVFDSSTNLWHERVFLNQGQFERHRADCHAFVFDTHVVGDYETGKIYELSSDVYSDNGAEIARERVSPHLSEDLVRMFYDTFQLDIQSGVGLDGTQQGTNPQAMLQFSDDGGHSWSNEKWASLGKIGQTKARAIWRKLGASRDRVFKVRITDPVKVVLIGADLGLMKGAS
jgi:hypothetical protein